MSPASCHSCSVAAPGPQNSASLKPHRAHARMAQTYNPTLPSAGEDAERLTLPGPDGGSAKGHAATLKKTVSHKVKHPRLRHPSSPTPSVYPRERRTRAPTDTRKRMFIAALFVMVPNASTQVSSLGEGTHCAVSTQWSTTQP